MVWRWWRRRWRWDLEDSIMMGFDRHVKQNVGKRKKTQMKRKRRKGGLVVLRMPMKRRMGGLVMWE